MNKRFKIKKGDTVVVITGKDKGKSGNVTSIITDKNRVFVQGINIVKKHRKATQENPGKIEDIEASIHISNVSHVDPETSKPTRVKYEFKDGLKKRVSVASGAVLDK
jgi:large subunit ribosomal protein L24